MCDDGGQGQEGGRRGRCRVLTVGEVARDHREMGCEGDTYPLCTGATAQKTCHSTHIANKGFEMESQKLLNPKEVRKKGKGEQRIWVRLKANSKWEPQTQAYQLSQ